MTFEHQGNLHGLRNEIRKLCRYYPVPVVMDDAAVLQEHFLKDAVYKETTDGVQIGVFQSTMGYGVHLTVVNFHGHVIGNQQPVVIEPLRGYGRAAPEYWFTRIHVDHAPQLELVLPARNEVVSNDYWTELLVQCERAIYNAMARTEPQPKLRHSHGTVPERRANVQKGARLRGGQTDGVRHRFEARLAAGKTRARLPHSANVRGRTFAPLGLLLLQKAV